MDHYGALHTARGDINNIRNILLEGQQSQTGLIFILKEIVQNADDCKSTRLGIGWSDGLPKAAHPLLRGPAIVAVNNGPFSKRNAKSIRAIGLSSKENDSSAVGKFGLGLKTVFLICEAFFYLTGPHAEPGVEPRSMLNLWWTADGDEDDIPASSWDRLAFTSDDQQQIAKEGQRIGLEDGFTLWIPLRRHEHCQRGGYTAPIVENYPGDDPEQFCQEFQGELVKELAGLLPLLKHVQNIDLYDGQHLHGIAVQENSSQCLSVLNTAPTSQNLPLTGVINTVDSESYTYYGYQQLLNEPKLQALKERNDWPKNIPLVGPPEKQKAEPHCAVLLNSYPSQTGLTKLLIQWAVFLPTAEMPDGSPPEILTLDPEEDNYEDYVLTLHGFFFLQSDRRRIRSWLNQQQENNIYQEWNQTLAERGTLRLILPMLESFAQERSPETVKALTHTLLKSRLWNSYRQHICAEGSWICKINFGHSSQLTWCFIQSQEQPFTIPESTVELLPEIFPNLSQVCLNRAVTLEEWPRLTRSKIYAKWKTTDIIELLEGGFSSAPNTCASNSLIQVLNSFLDHAVPQWSSSSREMSAVTDALKKFLKSAFSTPNFQAADTLDTLIGKLSAEQVLGIPNGLSKGLKQKLLQLETSCLIIPNSLRSEKSTTPKLSVFDVYLILIELESEVRDSQGARSFVSSVISMIASRQPEVWRKICQLDLFEVTRISGSRNIREFHSLDWLGKIKESYRLFRGTTTPEGTESLAEKLAHTLKDSIYLSFCSFIDLPHCNANSTIALIKQKPALQTSPESRQKLVQEIAYSVNLFTDRGALRYLLHADPNHFDDVDDLLYAGPNQKSNVNSFWSKVLKQIIKPNQHWRFIDSKLLEVLSPQQCQALGIANVDAKGVEQELNRIATSGTPLNSLKWDDFSWEECEKLIYNLPSNISNKLRIHEPVDTNGSSSRVAIDEHTYLQGESNDIYIEPSLAQKLGIIQLRRSSRIEIAEKQSALTPPISARTLIEHYLLKLDNPVDYWRVILNALKHAPEDCGKLNVLFKVKWLPLQPDLRLRNTCALKEIIHLPVIQEEVQKICAEHEQLYIASQNLAQDLQNHNAFKDLRKLFPPQRAAFDMLGEMLLLSENDRYRIGTLTEILVKDKQVRQQWFDAFIELPDDVMPASRLLAKLRNCTPTGTEQLFEILGKPVGADRLITILNSLADCHRNTKNNNDLRSALLETYRQYLKLASESDKWVDILQDIQLLSQSKQWKTAQKLCYGAINVAQSDVLHNSLAEIISEKIEQANAENGDSQLDADFKEIEDEDFSDEALRNSNETLRLYFKDWPRRTNNAIGLLLRLLGGKGEIEELARVYFPRVDYFLEEIYEENDNDKRNTINFLVEDIEKTKCFVCKHQSSVIRVKSLTGEKLQVQLLDEGEAESLIVGDLQKKRQSDGYSYIQLSLRLCQFLDEIILSRLAKQSFHTILSKFYGYHVTDLENFWDKLQDQAPPDIRVTQNLLLDDAILSLRSQLSLDHDSKIKSLIHKHFDLRKQHESLVSLQEKSPERRRYDSKLQENQRDLRENKKEIRNYLINDEETQRAFLLGVRQRIKNANYDIYSVPFELFQNADDACWELREMGHPNVSRQFTISLANKSLCFIHWGRGINQYQYNGQDWSNRGYSNDLQKMLLLNFSDKSEGVTGKFGLGFKSIFLLTSKPRVVSDRIGFDVIGGVYPKELSDEDFKTTTGQLGDSKEGTIVKLNVNESDARPVVEKFVEYLPLLGAFSRWLREFKVRIRDNRFTWTGSEKAIDGICSVYTGRSKEIKNNESLNALLLGEPGRRCLIPLNSSGAIPLSSNYPTFWVTTPTRMLLKVGFAINGPFRLDIGRSQLDLCGGGKQFNEELAKEMGRMFSQALINLYQLNEVQLCQALNLTTGTTRLTFWTSIWNILSDQFANQNFSDKGIDLLKHMFWVEKEGMPLLYTSCEALPTQLPKSAGQFNCLTRLGNIQWAVSGILNADEAVLTQVLDWPVLVEGQHQIRPGQVVSYSVAEVLKKLTKLSVKCLDLLTVIKWQLARIVSPEVSLIVEQLINQAFLANLPSMEAHSIQEFLKTVQFQSRGNNSAIAQNLLVVESSPKGSEESRLALFAPASALLAEEYEYGSLGLFYACRSGDLSLVSLPVEVRGQWVLEASPEQHEFCVQYLVKSEHRDKLIQWLKGKLRSSWLTELPSKRQILQQEYRIDPFSFDALLYNLGLLVQSINSDINSKDTDIDEDNNSDEATRTAASPALSIKDVLINILEWWSEARSRLIAKYEKSIYPCIDLQLNQNNYNDHHNPHCSKKRWLTLFTLGVFHTMGRTNLEQHRTFLQLCEDWGWLDVMVTGEVDEAGWINLLDRYFTLPRVGDRLQYYQWVRYYPAFYAFSKWLDAYRDSLLATNDSNAYLSISPTQLRNPIDLVLNPKQNPALQGTGIGQGAPPIGSILGIGSTFIVRELVRGGILSNPGMRPYAYVPVRRVRAMLFAIGCSAVRGDSRTTAVDNSMSIYEFLVKHLGEEDATYLGDYDLPFLMLQEEPRDIQERLLGRFPVPHEPLESEEDVYRWVNFPQHGNSGEWRTRWDGVRFPLR
uniref:Sacsin/Nov domain-containing protein n=1 Tax=Cyanothece sp. (strain PCC 7425 / ATCC 29141) TaxID=395961 RepID=B8HYW5_CYAP4